MNKIICGAFLLLLIQGLALAADNPPVFTGNVGKTGDVNVCPAIGYDGVLFVRSQARWDELNKVMPKLITDAPLPKFDFTKQSVVLLFAHGCRFRDAFTLSKSALAADPPELSFTCTWDNSPEEQLEMRYMKFILAAIPSAPMVHVTLISQPINVDRASIATEFSAIIGDEDGGDIVDGLQAAITAKAATIKPGEDIQIDFVLHLANPGEAKPERLRPTPKSICVWDGKYSNGYRNHAFLVTTPDGKTALLRPAEIDQWEKNVPHPVKITAKESYHLPSWAESETYKSLKQLGLDTSKPGTYTITGVYEETGSEPDNADADKNKTPLWGGSIASNTITVEVKP